MWRIKLASLSSFSTELLFHVNLSCGHACEHLYFMCLCACVFDFSLHVHLHACVSIECASIFMCDMLHTPKHDLCNVFRLLLYPPILMISPVCTSIC